MGKFIEVSFFYTDQCRRNDAVPDQKVDNSAQWTHGKGPTGAVPPSLRQQDDNLL